MRPLRYSINVTLDGCCDHRAIVPDEELHQFHADSLARSDGLLYGRVTYQMMEEGWRDMARTGVTPAGTPDWMVPFARVIDRARKHVVSHTLEGVDWNAELVRGDDLEAAVLALKRQPGKELLTGGVMLPRALAELGLIDLYEFVVMPHIAGHGPTLLAGLSTPLSLRLVDRQEFGSGAVVLRYEPRRSPEAQGTRARRREL